MGIGKKGILAKDKLIPEWERSSSSEIRIDELSQDKWVIDGNRKTKIRTLKIYGENEIRIWAEPERN